MNFKNLKQQKRSIYRALYSDISSIYRVYNYFNFISLIAGVKLIEMIESCLCYSYISLYLLFTKFVSNVKRMKRQNLSTESGNDNVAHRWHSRNLYEFQNNEFNSKFENASTFFEQYIRVSYYLSQISLFH